MYRFLVVSLLLLFFVFQYRLWIGNGSMSEVSHLQQQIATQQAELDRLRQSNAALKADVEDLRAGNEAIEERARTDLGMIRSGEIFYQIIEEHPSND